MEWQPAAGRWSRIDWTQPAHVAAADPYLIVADTFGMPWLSGDKDRIPVLVELESGDARAFDRRLKASKLGRVGPLYLAPAGTDPLRSCRHCTAVVKRGFFGVFRQLGVLRYAIGAPRLHQPDAAPAPDPAALRDRASRSDGPLVAVIDDGLPFLHHNLRTAGSTRVLHFMNLDSGHELDRTEVDRLRDQDEITAYRRQGYGQVMPYDTHGAHVMDLAAGRGGRHDVVLVQLPHEMVADSSGGMLPVHALDAIRYVLDRAGSDRPVVVNLSFGAQAGPHDGTSLLECAMDELLHRRRMLAIVLPAGNSHEARCHVSRRIQSSAHQRFAWRVMPDDATDSFCEFWSEPVDAAHPGLQLRVTTPGGAVGPWIASATAMSGHASATGAAQCTLVGRRVVQPGGLSRCAVLVALAPTRGEGGAPHGVWSVEIRSLGPPIQVEGWIERDGPVFGTDAGGKQGFFEDDEPGVVETENTLNSIACGERTLVVGAFVRTTGTISAYSASGARAAHAMRSAPDLCAVGDEHDELDGVEAAGTRSGYNFRLGGTSIATAQVTRRIADLWADDPDLGDDKAHLVQALVRGHPLPAGADPLRGGAGFSEGRG